MMQVWLPAGPCLANAFRKFVPDPQKAQEKRFSLLSTGPTSDPSAAAVKACSPKGPVLYQVTKMAPQPATPGRFYCIGRVFSGTLSSEKCFLLEDGYLPPRASTEAQPE